MLAVSTVYEKFTKLEVGILENVSQEQMAVLYNIADMINKIGFGVVAWMGAKKATEMMA